MFTIHLEIVVASNLYRVIQSATTYSIWQRFRLFAHLQAVSIRTDNIIYHGPVISSISYHYDRVESSNAGDLKVISVVCDGRRMYVSNDINTFGVLVCEKLLAQTTMILSCSLQRITAR